MAESTEKKSSQVTLAAVLGTLVFGLFSTRGGVPGENSKAGPDAMPVADAAARAGGTGGSSTLAPLEEVLLGRQLDPSGVDVGPLGGLIERWKETFGGQSPRIHCLVALVPDPASSSVSFRFDETLDSIERAAVSHQFVLERWRFPWQMKAAAGRLFEVGVRWSEHRTPPDRPSPGAGVPGPAPGEPGLLVFRKVLKATSKPELPVELLAVFLVAESPTHGVDRPALARSLGLIDQIHGATSGDDAARSRTVRVFGPSFSGSMPSLRDALKEWPARGDARPITLDIVSGAASAFEKERFQKDLDSPTREVRFSSAVHRTNTTCDAVLQYLSSTGSLKAGEDVVILSELNTVTGELTNAEKRLGHRIINLRYSLHIGDIRRVYESQGLLKGGGTEALRAALEIRQQAEDGGKARDILPDQTPGQTAISDNRTLTQALKYLDDGQFRKVGIIATDPHDAIFLARLIDRYCPDATVFILGSELMLMDPEVIADMRGVIVGSTYPLFPLNHVWTGSDDSSRATTFPSQHAQGSYNAAVLLLDRMLVGDEGNVAGKGLLEYATPQG